MAARVDFEITDNAPWGFPWQFEDGNGTPIDYTGSTFQMDIRAEAGGTLVQSLTSGNGGIVHGDLANGEITAIFPTGITPGTYVHDCLRLSAGVAVEVMWRGTLLVELGVTEVAP